MGMMSSVTKSLAAARDVAGARVAAAGKAAGARVQAARNLAGAGVKAAYDAVREFLQPVPTEFSKVFEKELDTIRQRRNANAVVDKGDPPLEELPDFGDTSGIFGNVVSGLRASDEAWKTAQRDYPYEFLHAGLVGMALSGGGIRSATFNLGVLQVLDKAGIFARLDYLSTVSGGGYIGCCLNSLYSSGMREFPFTHTIGQVENRWFKHLREYSNYLAPGGLLDRLRMPALFLRGLFLNFILILPFVLMAAALYVLLVATFPDLTTHFRRFHYTGQAVLILGAVFLLYPIVRRGLGTGLQSVGNWSWREEASKGLGWYLGLIICIAFVELQPHAIAAYKTLADKPVEGAQKWASLSFGDIAGALVGVLTAVSAIFGARRAWSATRVTGNFSLYVLGVLGPLTLWVLFLILCKWGVYPMAGDDAGAVESFVFKHADLLSLDGANSADRAFLLLYLGLGIYVLGWFINVNDYSLHSFYRDRLSKAFLMSGKGKEGTRPGHNDDQRLTGLNTDLMPYHIINAALNVTRQDKGKSEEQLQQMPGRTAESLIITKDFVGSSLTGYCETEKMESSDPWLNLGTAMAISGAAFSPNMGNVTIRPLVFILTMLNVRLGYWLQNPRTVKRTGLYERLKMPGRWLLMNELLSKLDETDQFVNVSDGGHMDNLGIYELLRRRCRLIIASDAEADPHYRFQGLAVVSRLAKIDFGIDIKFSALDLDMIRNGVRHYAIGTIRYGEDVEGKMIYVKASLVNGDADVYVNHYAALHTDFPHQTTLDQFFNEEQFECYRALGFQAARTVFLP